ncbi:pentapeptide repeat-containing protein [Streptomyces alboflavus]|uniref:pentapeptide repeat-containing protein n=1 Tax=Streptomyces alboflavus TaxID=67267 RepID=UPI0036937426
MEPYGACLEHLSENDRAAYVASLAPGSNIDHRGTRLSPQLLEPLLSSLLDPSTSQVRFGAAMFGGAQFSGDAWFDGVQFSDAAMFEDAQFSGDARFGGVQFSGAAAFGGAQFSGGAAFLEAQFSGTAGFQEAQFIGDASFREAQFAHTAGFSGAQFSGTADFREVRFSGGAGFGRAQFTGPVLFVRAQFETTSRLGPLVCQQTLVLSGARFGAPVTVEAAAAWVVCEGTRWDAKSTLRLRYAALVLSEAVMEYPLTITFRMAPFLTGLGSTLAEGELADTGPDMQEGPQVRMVSLSGADAAHLALHNVDLSECLFFGALHLDQLRLEGRCPLALAPAGWRWTKRSTLAEEHHWRARQGQPGWTAAPDEVEVHSPGALAPVYRQLRKSLEDGKDEPGAADFYYGEMTMRRHDDTRPPAERVLLTAYWALSGYGLRASRALAWLVTAMAATVLVMMLWGLPASDPKPAATGRLTGGQDISLTTDTPDPANPTGPITQRLTSQRWEKSARVVVNSVVFRSSGQDLTTTGTYTEMTSRLLEPTLLALAVLAVRSRIKR